MKRPDRAAWLATILFGSAVVASFFFHGFRLEFLCIAQAALLICVVLILWQSHNGLILPRTALVVGVTAYWAWMGASLLWTEVPAIGALNFWWMSSLPLAFWLSTLWRTSEVWWRNNAVFILCVAVALAVVATYQAFVQQDAPRSVFINLNSHAAMMNLVLLPAAGYLTLHLTRAKGSPRLTDLGLGIAVFSLAYALAITRGRGALLAFGVSVVCFIWLARAHVSKRALALTGALISTAFVAAYFTWQGAVFERLETLSNPTSAGATRLVIWQQAWAMIAEQPWWGRGPGTFSLAYPSYRLPSDSSAGAFVHNDYLQTWIELGLPGLIFFLGIALSLVWIYMRARNALAAAARVEAAALLSGLLAMALHSFVDFNFYQIPLLLIAGLMLGRLQSLFHAARPADEWIVRPSALLGRPAYRTLVLLVAAIPLTYFAAMAAAAVVYDDALALAQRGEIERADAAFERAMHLAPVGDTVAISRADLYRQVLRTRPDLAPERRLRLYTDALEWLARAERQNPLRPLVYLVRGMLIAENATLAGGDWRERAIADYRRALNHDPRFHPARVEYAELQLRNGEVAAARQMLEDGLRYWYLDYEAIVPYYALTARLRREAGDVAGAEELESRIKLALENSGWRWVPRADAAPATGSGYTALPVK